MKIVLSRLHQLQLYNEAYSGCLHINKKCLFMTNKCAQINQIPRLTNKTPRRCSWERERCWRSHKPMCATGSGITLGEALALDFFVVRHLNNLLDPLFLVFNFMLIPKKSQVLEPGAQSEQPWNEGGSGRTRYPHIWTPRPALACSSLWSRRTYWKYRNRSKTFAERLLPSSISRDSSQNLRQQILVPKKSRAPVWPLSHQQPRSPESSLCRCHIDRSTTRREARSQYKDCLHWRCSPKEVARKLEGTLYWLAPSRVCNEASKPVQVGWFLVGSKNATRVWNPHSKTFEKPHQRPAHWGIAG